MSVGVAPEKLASEVARYGPMAYVITVGEDGRPHAVSVEVAWESADLVISAGRKTRTNAADRPAVTLLWPALAPEDYSLIVDGRASVGEEKLSVEPLKAVLHRAAAGPGPAGSHGSDCVAVLG